MSLINCASNINSYQDFTFSQAYRWTSHMHTLAKLDVRELEHQEKIMQW